MERDAEFVLDDGSRNEPASVQLDRAERPALDQVADTGLRHADHLGHLTGPIGHTLEWPPLWLLVHGVNSLLDPRAADTARAPNLPSLLVMARTVSRTKETNPYESTAITEVRVEGCGPSWLTVAGRDRLGAERVVHARGAARTRRRVPKTSSIRRPACLQGLSHPSRANSLVRSEGRDNGRSGR